MSLTTRLILILTLILPAFGELFAQEATATTAPSAVTSTATTTAATDTAAGSDPKAAPAEGANTEEAGEANRKLTSDEVRNQFTALLRQHPPEVAMILKLDPALLSDATYMTRYPEIVAFLERYPEVRQHPRYYLLEFPLPAYNFDNNNSVVGDILEPLIIGFTFVAIGLVLAWVVRTIVEQKRWSRLSRTQAEVHNKILDRFGTSTELLEYIRTPAGTKFLESAPIPLHTTSAAPRHPHARAIWSVQIGVVVGAAALGMLMVSAGLEKGDAQALFAMGVIALCVGLGFIGSAAVSIVLSRRLGLWQAPPAASEPGVVP